ncbi:beta-lactamase family protein [Nonomuraea sp. KC401]|uniref:serine hydrolase domain-containing protein n=1 Tax=unclassified Nonomuraea TaxID=2593643 RepID=UPI0010FD61E3|nr:MULTISPECIES: serine hydrolase domain-containing protein [unclassified Nonomuraea]NBE99102.1 serine hydrolase [Nonomuraea sp. K271]TLF58151.1 beta-lactamase family protein [Nonomuraea sp. KC401]
MKRAHVAAALTLATLFSAAVPAPATAGTTPSTVAPQVELPPIDQAALKRSIAGLPASDATAAEVRVGGAKGSWRGFTGVTDLRTNRPAKAGARFRAGSVTKVFTVAVVLQLVAEGKISLDDTVQRRLPGLLPRAYPAVKVGQLLNHTSGLPSPEISADFKQVYATRFRKWTPREYVREAVKKPMEFAPGTQQHYVDMNTFVAGLLIEKVTGRSYEREVTTRIFAPLGMRDSYLPGDSVRIRGRHNHGYQLVPDDFKNAIRYGRHHVVDMTVTTSTYTWASGDLISTTTDLETFVKALFGGKVVPAAQLEHMFTVPRVPTYGTGDPAMHTSGMSRLELPGGLVVYGKTGARYGSAAAIGATRDLSRTVVYAVNSTDAKAVSQNERGMGIVLAAFAT